MSILMILNDYRGTSGLLGQVIINRGGYYTSYQPHGDQALTLGAGQLPTKHQDFQGLVVLGGAMDAWDDAGFPALASISKLIRGFHDAHKPVLGICLGAQLLARTLGARVYRHHQPEIGFSKLSMTPAAGHDALLHDLPSTVQLMQWHYDTFDLPKDATLLMTGEVCRHQGFRVGRSYGFQCHFEVTLDIIREWVRSSAVQERHPHLAASLEGQCRQHLVNAQHFGTNVMERWLKLCLN